MRLDRVDTNILAFRMDGHQAFALFGKPRLAGVGRFGGRHLLSSRPAAGCPSRRHCTNNRKVMSFTNTASFERLGVLERSSGIFVVNSPVDGTALCIGCRK